MRLWHEELITKLPNRWLGGQHNEICGMRGLGFGKKHSVVNYVFKGNFETAYTKLFNFHMLVMKEREKRGLKVSPEWKEFNYRGKKSGYDNSIEYDESISSHDIYSEHDDNYLCECLENLWNKGILIKISLDKALTLVTDKINNHDDILLLFFKDMLTDNDYKEFLDYLGYIKQLKSLETTDKFNKLFDKMNKKII